MGCGGSKGPKKDPKKLTDEEIKLLMDNTRLTKPQILALHRNFVGECPSGKLTKKDFVKLFKEVHPSENKKLKADKFCEYVFKVIDKQNLGYISFQEFVLCFILTSDGDFQDKCDFAFRLYDLDKDNKINKKEMTQVLTALYDLSGITDRKGDAAVSKKVDDIIKKINIEHSLTAAKPAEPAPVVLDKKGKPIKPKAVKAAKGPEYITKDQFIAACTSDDQIKELFVDSIFCGGPDSGLTFTTKDGRPLTEDPADVHVHAGNVDVNIHNSVTIQDDAAAHAKVKMPKVNATATPTRSGPGAIEPGHFSWEMTTPEPLVTVNAEAPVVAVAAAAESTDDADVHVKVSSSENASAPDADVHITAAADATADADAVDVEVVTPSATVTLADATAPSLTIESPSAEVTVDVNKDDEKVAVEAQ